ncbi:MAG: hypothetical protein V4498_00010 [candidate division FCPU426 bacterium]
MPGPQPEVPPIPGLDADTSIFDWQNRGEQKRTVADQTMFRNVARGGQQAAPPVQGEGQNFRPVRGQELFDQTYVRGPQELAETQKQLGELEGQRHEATAARYGQETERATGAMAANQVRRQADDQEIARRQGDLDRATQTYTNDLHDQNKFWQSPGNILSAIAFSLMPIFSNDPTIGAKLINQAIDRDMTNRKDLANMHLGELRSNLGTYRKLAEDHQVGDQIAQAEAHRIAAGDIERISQQFASPIAKKKALALAQDQQMRAGQVQMTAFNHYAYNQARRMDPGVLDAYKMPGKRGQVDAQGNPDGWRAYDIPTTSTGKNVVGSIAGTPSVASAGKPVAAGQMSQAQVASMAHHPGEVVRAGLDGRLDSDDILTMHENSIAANAAANAKGIPGTDAWALSYNEYVEKERQKAREGVGAIAEMMAPHVANVTTTRRLSSDMADIEKLCATEGIRPDDFLGDLRNVTGGALAAKIQDLRIKYNNDSTDTAAQRIRMDRLKAAERFHQVFAGKIAGYYHDMAGAAQNKAELDNLGQYITTAASWDKIKSFVHAESVKYGSNYKNALIGKGNPYSAQLFVAENGNGDPTLPYAGREAPIPKTGRPTPVAARADSRNDEPTGKVEFAP